jgi:hypothetical protein
MLFAFLALDRNEISGPFNQSRVKRFLEISIELSEESNTLGLV